MVKYSVSATADYFQRNKINQATRNNDYLFTNFEYLFSKHELENTDVCTVVRPAR